MREAARRGAGRRGARGWGACDWRARRCPTVARPRAPRPTHFLSRHKGRFKYFGMLFGDISPAGGGERNAASGIWPHASLGGTPPHARASPVRQTLPRKPQRVHLCQDTMTL